jgi:oxygen-independent coproporphyrinogen-3 oxidase
MGGPVGADGPSGAGGVTRAPLVSVYLGGGTPSLLSARQVSDLLEHVDRRLGISDDAEITLEADPEPDVIGDLVGLRAAGVTRLSLGAQSLDAAELRLLGRRHVPDDVRASVAAARQAGLRSLSLDLLTDLPGASVASWRRTLGGVLALEPDHLSVYQLSLADPQAEGLAGPGGDHLPVSRGARAWRDRARVRQSQDRAARMEEVTDELAGAAGLVRYEIANLARPGHESRHNQLYWRCRPYLGLGPGAHSHDGAQRRSWNAAHLDGYLAALVPEAAPLPSGVAGVAAPEPGDAAPGRPAGPRLPPGASETLDAETSRAERIILGLRLVEGVDATLASGPHARAALHWARRVGLVAVVGERTRLTRRGRLLADEVFMRLLPDRPAHAATAASAPDP